MSHVLSEARRSRRDLPCENDQAYSCLSLTTGMFNLIVKDPRCTRLSRPLLDQGLRLCRRRSSNLRAVQFLSASSADWNRFSRTCQHYLSVTLASTGKFTVFSEAAVFLLQAPLKARPEAAMRAAQNLKDRSSVSLSSGERPFGPQQVLAPTVYCSGMSGVRA